MTWMFALQFLHHRNAQRHTLLCFPTLLAPAVPFAQAHHCLDSKAMRGTCTLAAPHRRKRPPKPLRPGRRSCCCRDQASAYGTCGTSNETVRHGERVREVSKRGIKTVRRQVTCNRAIAPPAQALAKAVTPASPILFSLSQSSCKCKCGTPNKTVRPGEHTCQSSRHGIKALRRQLTCNCAMAPPTWAAVRAVERVLI